MEFRPSGSHALFLADQYPYRDMRIELKQVNHRCHALIMEAYDKAEGEASFFQQLDTIFLSMMNKQDDAMAALMQGLSAKTRIADVMDSFGYSRPASAASGTAAPWLQYENHTENTAHQSGC